MVQFRIMAAQLLQNERQRAKNRKKNINVSPGKRIKITLGCVNGKMLAEKVYPDQLEVSRVPNASRLLTGNIKMLSCERLIIIANFYGVDGNFIIGLPSIHDDDFKRLVKDN